MKLYIGIYYRDNPYKYLYNLFNVIGAPKRYISDKTDKGFINIPLMS